MARLTKGHKSLGGAMTGLRWSVVGEIALANIGSSAIPKIIDLLVAVKDKKRMETSLAEKGYERSGGGDYNGFKFTCYGDDMNVFFYHPKDFPPVEGFCTTAKNWPLAHHAVQLAWGLLGFTKQGIANAVDVMIGGLEIDWEMVQEWLKKFGSRESCADLIMINESITQDDEVWENLI